MCHSPIQKYYDKILSDIQKYSNPHHPKSDEVFDLYLEIGRLALIAEKGGFYRHNPLEQVAQDLQKVMGQSESFSVESLHKMKELFLAYRVVVNLCHDLEIN